MAKVKMNEPVYGPDDEVTTLSELADAGKLEFKQETTWTKKRQGERGERIVYMAYFVGTNRGYEIGKAAFQSRTGQPVTI